MAGGDFIYGDRVCQTLNKYDFLSVLQTREGVMGRKAGGFTMDLGEEAKTTQWASEP